VRGKPRYLPADTSHMEATTDKQCLSCHGSSADFPMSREHPPKYKKCYLCHRKKKG
jgi:hypothetical protein